MHITRAAHAAAAHHNGGLIVVRVDSLVAVVIVEIVAAFIDVAVSALLPCSSSDGSLID